MSGVIGDGKSNTAKLASTVGSPNSQGYFFYILLMKKTHIIV